MSNRSRWMNNTRMFISNLKILFRFSLEIRCLLTMLKQVSNVSLCVVHRECKSQSENQQSVKLIQ